MQTLELKQKPKLKPISLVLFGAVVALYFAAVALSGGRLFGALLYYIGFALLVVVPGLALCDLLLPALGAAARMVVGVSLGGGVLVLGFALFGSLGAPYLAALAPLALCALWAVRRLKRGRQAKKTAPNDFYGLLLLLAAALALCIVTGVFRYAWPSAVGRMTYNQDALWGVGSAASAWYGFPIRDLRTAGGFFHYHYFSDALAGIVAAFTGQHTWDVNFFYLRIVWVALLLLGVWAASRELGAGGLLSLVPTAGVAFFMFRNFQAVSYVFVNQNNVNQSYVFVLAAVLALLCAQKNGFKDWRALSAVVLCCVVVVWSKGSVGVLLLLGMAAGFVVWMITHRRFSAFLLAALALGALGTALLYLLLFSKANINIFFSPDAARASQFLVQFLKSNAPLLALYIICLLYYIRHFVSISFVELTLNAMVLGGIAANCLFDHYGGAVTYFYLMACFLMWLLIARVLPRLAKPLVGKIALGAVLAVALAGNIVTLAPLVSSGAQAAGARFGVAQAPITDTDPLSADDEAAALWLRENMDRDDVFATNLTERHPTSPDGVFHGYTALSGRQAFVEGWFYAMEYSMDYTELRHNLEQVNASIYEAETFEQAAAIAREHGITHILLHLPTRGAAFFDAAPAFKSPTVVIYIVD